MKRLMLCGLWAAAALAAAAGCSEPEEPAGTPPVELRLEASAERVAAGEEVAFTVYADGEPVTDATVRRADTGAELAGNFSADEAGCYRFVAEREGVRSDETVVAVNAPFEEEGSFYRRVLVQKFTGTWCIYCPQMTSLLDQLGEERPDRMVHMSVHINDGFSITDGTELAYTFGIMGIPQAVFDYRSVESSRLPDLRSALDTELGSYPARCGIALRTERSAGGPLRIEARVRCSEEGDYQVCCAVVEDSLYSEGGTAPDHLYHHVLRRFVGASCLGLSLGRCERGWEYPLLFECTLPERWNTEQCRAVVYVLAERNGERYVTNAVSVPLEGSCGFDREPAAEA